jgi:ribosomal protein L17
LQAAQTYIKSVVFTTSAIKKLNTEIAPRLKEQEITAGFTRIEKTGQRFTDSVHMCYIEIIGNPIEVWEKQEKRAWSGSKP